MVKPRTIAIVCNGDFYLHRFKGSLLSALSNAGYTVYAIAPAGKSVAAIEREGATFVDWPLARRRASPWSEVKSVLALRRRYREIKPDLAHHLYAKPNIYGAIAARLAGVPVAVASVNGLGYVFVGRALKSTIIRPVVSLLYRLAFGISEAVLATVFNFLGLTEKGGKVIKVFLSPIIKGVVVALGTADADPEKDL